VTVTPRAIKDLHERKARALTRRPAFARATGQARVVLEAGFACAVEDEDRRLTADLPVKDGGDAAGPSPDQLMRASLGAALAIGYRLWAARLEVPLAAAAVDVTCDYDSRGQLGVDGVAVGWQRLCVEVTITSAAPEADVRRVVETADRLSPMLANLAATVVRTHRLTVVKAVRP
jgi:uncharacterized OsmC-like protein